MQVYEKINFIIKQKKLTKRAFSNLLRNLEPKLKITGEVPSENTIYSYLTGRITIPIELLTFIAEALDVSEQELFDTSSKARKKCFKYFLQEASKDELEYFYGFINSQIKNNVNVNYGKIIMNSEITDEKLEKFSELLKYAPANFIDKVVSRLEEYKKLDSLDF